MGETPMSPTIDGKAILVTGANRGIGQALVTEALRRGAARVYAGTRQPYAHQDPRVTPLALDITNEGQVGAAAAGVESLDILVNNAGVFLFDDLSDRAALERRIPKASPQSVEQGILDAVEKGEDDIFPDPQSAALAHGWHAGPAKALERQNAALLQPQPIASQPVPGKGARQ